MSKREREIRDLIASRRFRLVSLEKRRSGHYVAMVENEEGEGYRLTFSGTPGNYRSDKNAVSMRQHGRRAYL